MSGKLAAERCADCGRPFGHPSTYRLVNGRAVCRARGVCNARIARRYAELMRAERKQRGEALQAVRKAYTRLLKARGVLAQDALPFN